MKMFYWILPSMKIVLLNQFEDSVVAKEKDSKALTMYPEWKEK